MKALQTGESKGWDSDCGAVPARQAFTADWQRRVELQTTVREPCWYALRTRPRYEQKVTAQLGHKGIKVFLPLLSQVHRWSDRRKVVQVPLFPGYLFVHVPLSVEARLEVLQTIGVVSFVGSHGQGLAIPDKQVEDIRTILDQKVPCTLYPFLRAGQRVRIRGGCLDGVEGLLVACNSDRSLVISLGPIRQSLAIRVQGYDVEILAPPAINVRDGGRCRSQDSLSARKTVNS